MDILIFGLFLVITLFVGLGYGRQVSNIRDYALGGKNFTTSTLIATVMATRASGSLFFMELENSYTNGLYLFIAVLGLPLGTWVLGQLAMRMQEFMHHVSVAEAMSSMYGRTVQIITACSCILGKAGLVAVQFKVIAKVLEVTFDVEGTLGTYLAAVTVIAYSSFGGVKAVTFTDVFQLLVFGLALPSLAFIVWKGVQLPAAFAWTAHPHLDLRQVMSWDNKLFFAMGLFSYLAIPGFSPSIFQRIAMARNIRQARRAFNCAAGCLFLMLCITSGIAFLLLMEQPGLAKAQVFPYLISKCTFVGLKGLLGAGVIAMAMSTADSCLNALSVIFANDLVKPLTNKAQASVKTAQTFSVVVGGGALLLALHSQDILKLLLFSGSFYRPIFTVPMLLAVLGFRTSTRAVLLSMAAGFATVVVWSFAFTNASSIVPGMVANLVVLLSTHYLWGRLGGGQNTMP